MSLRGRGRPSRQAGPAVTRADLLRLAAARVGRVGFTATSIRDLATDAGVSHGAVQHHFPNKAALWEALVHEVLVPALARPVPSDPAALAAVPLDVLRERIQAVMTRPGLSAAILFDRSEGHAERLAVLAEALREQRATDLAALAALMEAGHLRRVDPRVAAALFGVLLPTLSSAGPALRALLDLDLDDANTREHLAQTLADILLHGLLPR